MLRRDAGHPQPSGGNLILDASDGTGQVGYGDPPSSYSMVELQLAIGSVYEVVVFQAERWCCGANYMLSLANFLAGNLGEKNGVRLDHQLRPVSDGTGSVLCMKDCTIPPEVVY